MPDLPSCIHTFSLDDVFPGHNISVCLVRNVENAKELREQIQQRKFDASFLNAEMVADEFHLLAAAAKAMSGLVNNSLTTHGIHTELIYCMSGAKSISDALNHFGISQDSTSVILAVFDAEHEAVESILTNIRGSPAPLNEVKSLCNAEKLKKVYKIQDEELSLPGSSLSECAVCRIAIRDSL